jgi:hypothetical protein
MCHSVPPRLAIVVLAAALGLTCASTVIAQAPARPKPVPAAQSVVDAALRSAKASNKGVFIHFSASWCTFCHKLTAFLESPDGKTTFGAYFVSQEVIVNEVKGKEALENAGGAILLKKWSGADDTVLPYFAFLDASGKKIGDSNAMPDGTSVGYPSTPDAAKAFDALLIKVAPRMSGDTRAKILNYIATHK